MRKLLLLLVILACTVTAQVTMVHNDLGATGTSSAETILTPTNVAGNFRMIGTLPVDDYVMAQVLVVPGIVIGGKATNIAIVSTINNSVYAFDADNIGTAALWHINFGATNTSYAGQGAPNQFYQKGFGCWSTPVADTVNSVLYIVCGNSSQNWVLHKLNLVDGSTSASVTISGSVVGTGDPNGGDCTSGANLLFCPAKEFQRPGLKLSGGLVYVTFGGVGDTRPYHGWVMAYDSTLTQQAIWCSTPNGWGGASWGGEPAIDGSGNVYVTTGNGTTYDGITTFTNSIVKLTPSLSVIGDWFEPANNVTINAADADTSSNRFILLPGTSPQLGVIASKDFNVYVIDTTCMGHLQGSSGCTLQTFKTDSAGVVGVGTGSFGAAFINGTLVLPITHGDSTYAFALSGQSFNTTPIATDSTVYGGYGPSGMAGSCNGTANCILWEATTAAGQSSYSSILPGTLHALNPNTLTYYWSSSDTWSFSKFVSPTISGGKVFMPTTSGFVAVYAVTNPTFNLIG